VNARFLVLLAILASGPLLMLLAWPLIADHVCLADLTVAVRTQPHTEVVVTGFLKNDKSEPFSIESLLIEEPGKEPYRRLVSLDADRKLELALGKPVAGTYRVAAWTRKADWLSGPHEGWLRVPELIIPTDTSPLPQQQTAQDYDYAQLLLFGSLIVAAQVACLLFWYRFGVRAHSTVAAPMKPDPGVSLGA
jgi:hypothetical protein